MEPDATFLPDEELYLRLNPDNFPPNYATGGVIPLHEVRFPAFSVNRSKYSQPEHVLQPYWPTWGIAAFFVADVPGPLNHPEEAIEYSFHVEHVPEPDNDAHSEVRMTTNPSEAGQEPPKTVKAEFRERLRRHLRLLRAPGSGPT